MAGLAGFPGTAACAAGAAAAPAIATPAPVTADFFRNFRRFNGMLCSSGTTNDARRQGTRADERA
ncbi:hypothetical protein GCM10010350_09700 [Streptomyces galilaeus]|nr:hypothetical protein GCM10010350_09700 [Streptomyces galilaeus]